MTTTPGYLATPVQLGHYETDPAGRAGFGITASRGLAGRYLEITVEVRCVRK